VRLSYLTEREFQKSGSSPLTALADSGTNNKKKSEVESMKKLIVGYEKFKSKKNVDCCAVSVETEYKPRDGVEQGGIKTETVMIYGEDITVIDARSIGKELVGFFGYYNGMCIVQNPAVQ